MAIHGESELIDNFIIELQPYLVLIDQAVAALSQPEPEARIVKRAFEALGTIRDASSVLGFAGLVALSSALETTMEELLARGSADPTQQVARAHSLAAGISRYMDALADGHDTDELVTTVLQPEAATIDDEPTGYKRTGPLDPGLLPDDTDPELRDIFIEEATELVASFTRGALMLVSAPDRTTLLTGLRRDAHTLKGAANMTGFPLIGSVGGAVESLLDAHIDDHLPVERETLGIVLSARKLLTGMLASLDDLSAFTEPAQSLTERATAVLDRIAPLRPTTIDASVEPVDELVAKPVAEATPEPAVEPIAVAVETPIIAEVIEPAEEPVEEPIAEIEEYAADPVTNADVTLIDAIVSEPSDEMVQEATVDTLTSELPVEIVSDDVTDDEPVASEVDVVVADEPGGYDLLRPVIDADLVPFSLDSTGTGDLPHADLDGHDLDGLWEPLADIVPTEADYTPVTSAEDPEPSISFNGLFTTEAAMTSDETADDEPDDDELDVYEMAAEIAQLARLRTSLLPQNAMFIPTEPTGLTDDINALTAEIIDGGTNDVAIPVVDEPVADEPTGIAEPVADLPEPSIEPLSIDGITHDGTTLGHALLDLAFDSLETAPGDASHITHHASRITDAEMQQELRETFAIEAADYADSLTLAAMALERDPDSDDAMRELTRVLHTLKGAAAAAGFDAIGERCHAIEDDLATGADINRVFTNQVLELASWVERTTTGDEPVDGVDIEIEMPSADTPLPEPAQPATRAAGDLRVDMRRLDGLLNLVGELVINRATFDQRLQRLSASLDELSHMTDRLRRSGQTLERVAGEASLFGPLPAPGDDRIVPFVGHDLRHEFDTLELDRYTDLDVLARELGEVASDIGAIAGEVRNLRGDFETVSTHQRRLTNEVQDELMSIRMVPLATLSPLLHRVVRRVANECGKEVELFIEGSEIAFDKALVDALGDALLHLLRNAVDHGIEPVAVRQASNKPDHGRIIVRAWQDRGNAVVEVIDDGGGIDTARLIERGRNYGFITAETVSEAEALQLMFLPGFSTRDSASSVSGRGIGLDAVREAVERVKGRVTVDTKPGAGTIFQLRLPVMLAVAQAFLVEAGGRRYAVPLADVDFVADRRQASLSRVGNAALVEINESVIPAIDLAHRLAGDADRLDEETGWLLVTRSGGEPKAMRVDALFGQQEIVVKPLGRYLSAAPGVTGATILGDGEIALIIDVTEVTGKRLLAEPVAQVTEPTPIDSLRTGPGTALIVDDSLSVRRVLSRTLERHGWTTIQAHDGVEALEAVQAGGIDIVVTDIEMPRMDGFELINSLRRGGWQSLPVVVLTSRSSSKHRDKAIELGANAYIVKPFQEQELLQTLERETTAIRVAG